MKVAKLRISLALLLTIFVSSCKDNGNPTGEQSNEEVVEEYNATKSTIQPAQGKLCFKKETSFKENPEDKDVIELNLEFKDSLVSGVYNYIPAFKDQRKGNLKGTISEDIFTAEYTFMQEGKEDTASLEIYLSETEAVISGGAPELGLNATLPQSECDDK